MKLVRIRASDTQAIVAVYEFLSDLCHEYGAFRKWYYDAVIPGLDNGKRLIYAVTDCRKIVAVLILKKRCREEDMHTESGGRLSQSRHSNKPIENCMSRTTMRGPAYHCVIIPYC